MDERIYSTDPTHSTILKTWLATCVRKATNTRGQNVVPSCPTFLQLAVGQNQWYHFGVGAPPILVYFSGSLGVKDFDHLFSQRRNSVRVAGA